MFHMMNEARLGVGLGAIALGYTGYLKSLQYARDRPQGRPVSAARRSSGDEGAAMRSPAIRSSRATID